MVTAEEWKDGNEDLSEAESNEAVEEDESIESNNREVKEDKADLIEEEEDKNEIIAALEKRIESLLHQNNSMLLQLEKSEKAEDRLLKREKVWVDK